MNLFRTLVGRVLYGMKDHHFTYVEGTTTILHTQCMLAGKDICSAAGEDHWVAGYVYGAHCALLQYRGIEPGPVAMDFLEKSYGFVFGTGQDGRRMLQRAIALEKDSEFSIGNQEGGDDVLNWLRTKQPTMRLAVHLRS